MSVRQLTILLLLSLVPQPVALAEEEMGSLILHKVTENVYGLAGPLGDRSASNLGNNATFGFVVTPAGVVLIDSGGTYKGAHSIDAVIQSVTDKPVKFVINTGGQDHRWLGNDYFKKQGATVIASIEAVQDQKARLDEILSRLSNTAGDEAMQGTTDSYADITFAKEHRFTLGGVEFELYHPGHAHSPGDSFVWIPQQKVVFTGDIAYTQRMLSMMWYSESKPWVRAYEAMAEFRPHYVVPGHGKPTTLDVADKDTYDYLTSLRKQVVDFMSTGGGIEDVNKIDQSRFRYLENYDQLKVRNAQKIYEEIEFE